MASLLIAVSTFAGCQGDDSSAPVTGPDASTDARASDVSVDRSTMPDVSADRSTTPDVSADGANTPDVSADVAPDVSRDGAAPDASTDRANDTPSDSANSFDTGMDSSDSNPDVVACETASTCPGQDTECQTRTCVNHACGFDYVPAGTALTTQVAGNCHTRRCNGTGDVVDAVDDADLPVDNNQCTDDKCASGTASNPNSAAMAPCTQNSGRLCDGNGACVACIVAGDCPGDDTMCQTRTCGGDAGPHTCGFHYTDAGTSCGTNLFCNGMGGCSPMCTMASDCPADQDNECQTHACLAGGLCGFNRQPVGTPVGTQTPGDCHVRACDATGQPVQNVDNTDVPEDSNQCTGNICTDGTPSNPPISGMACSQMSGRICSDALDGMCVQCNAPSDCPALEAGTETECHHRTCTSHVCGVGNEADGTVVTMGQTAGDCQTLVCSGGAIVSQDAAADLPADDGNACTGEACAGSPLAPVHDPAANAGLTCAGQQGGRCKSGTCVPTFVVLRVGDGITTLSSAAAAGFIERRYFDTMGDIVPGLTGTLALPTGNDAGAQQPLTFSGSAGSEGLISLSAVSQSGLPQYVVVAGYGAIPGTAAVASTMNPTVNRIVGRIDAAGSIDTSTRLNAAFSGANVRGATSLDGTVFWVSGQGGATGGIHFIDFSMTGGTQILAAPNNGRAVQIAGGQLYGTSNTASFLNVFTVGTGLPTTGQTATLLPGLTSTLSPYQFVFLARQSDAGAGFDTLYVADDRAVSTDGGMGGGIQKYAFNGTMWESRATFTDGLGGANSVRGLAGMVTGNTVTLVATTADVGVGNRIVMYVDDGVNTNPTQIPLATAGANTVYRGLAMAP